MVRLLLLHKADPEAINDEGLNAISIAARYGQFEVVHQLLTWGVNRSHITIEGHGILHQAVQSGYIGLVRYLEGLGFNLEFSDRGGNTPLMHAVRNHDHEMFRCLVALGAELYVENNMMCTPLSLAVITDDSSQIETTQAVLDAGCDINLVNSQGWSAIMYAVSSDSVSKVIFLLLQGANIFYQDDAGKSVFTVIGKARNRREIVALLLKNIDKQKQVLLGILENQIHLSDSSRFILELFAHACEYQHNVLCLFMLSNKPSLVSFAEVYEKI